ncbi:MAG: InlB B-repeat-containing protein [Clostridia bacterium]|nr:InlB B-repeat-containing protein [Clostridia bacterium]
MLKNTLKRTASCLMAIVMIVTTFFVFGPSGLLPTAGAALSAQNTEVPDVYIVVPETFYMTPSLNASSTVQYYINNTVNGTTITPDEERATTAGKIWFNVSDGTVTDLVYSILGTNKTNVSISAGSGSTTLYGVTLDVGMNASDVRTLEWVFTCSINGVAAEYHAFTVAYAPYYTPVGAAGNAKNANAGTQMQGIAWISGVHGYEDCNPTTAADSDKDNYVLGNYRARTVWDGEWNRPLVPMITSVPVPTNNDENISDWLSTTATGACDDETFTLYDVDKKASGMGAKSIDIATQSHIAELTVDVSRNHSFTTVPNVTTGFFVSDLKRDSKYMGAYGGYIANYDGEIPGIDFWFSRNHYGDGCGSFTATAGVDTAFFGGNTHAGTDQRDFNTDSIPYNGVWDRATPSATGTSMHYIHAAMCGEYSSNWIYINIYLFVNVTAVDKTALRNKLFLKQAQANAKKTDSYALVREKLENAYLALGDPTATQAAIDSASQGLDSIDSIVSPTETIYARHINQLTGEPFTSDAAEQLTVRRSDNSVTVAPNNYTGYSYFGTRRAFGTSAAFGSFDANAWAQSACCANGSGVSSVGYDSASRTITVNNSDARTNTDYPLGNVLNSSYYRIAVDPSETYTIDFDYASVCDARIGVICYDHSGDYIADAWLSDSFQASGSPTTFRHHTEIFCAKSSPYLFGLEKRSDVCYIVLTFGINEEDPQSDVPSVFTNVSFTPSDKLFDLAQWSDLTSSFRSSTNTVGIEAKTYDCSSKTLTLASSTTESNTSYASNNVLTQCEVSGSREYPWSFIPVESAAAYSVEGEYAGTGNGQILILHYNVNGSYTGATRLASSSAYGGILACTGNTSNFNPFFASFTVKEDDAYIALAFGGYNNPYATANSTVSNVFRDVKVHHAVDADKEYTLYYRPNTYTVSFDANGGSGTMAEQLFTYNVAQNLIANTYTRTGYTFDGWSTTAGGSKVYDDGDSVVDLTTAADGEVRLYACWKAVTYTIRYDEAGGTLTGSYITEYDINTPVYLANAVKDGYTLNGWRADNTGNWGPDLYRINTPLTGYYGNVKFTAVWKTNTYSVAFNPNGGEGTAMANQSFTYGVAQQLTACAFSRTGFTFLGWALTSDAADAEFADKASVQNLTVEANAVVTLYAVWGAKTYSIVYSTDGGEILDTSYTSSFTANDQISLPLSVEKIGYNFTGWKATGSVGSWNTDTVYTGTLNSGMIGNVTLQAQWTVKGYTILYMPNEGTIVGNRYTTSYDIVSPITLPTARRSGYIFGGWQADNTGNWRGSVYQPGDVSAGHYGDVTMSAVWTGVRYYVRFNGNGSTDGMMYNQSFTYGESGTLYLNEFVRNGYTFLGWSLSGAATEPTYEDGGEVINLALEAESIVTLYAVWGKSSYTIIYDPLNGVISEPGTTSYTITDTIILPTATRRGYALDGWSPRQNSGSWHTWDTYCNSISYGCYGDVTLVAKWVKSAYNITYDAADGTISGSYTTAYDIDTVIVLPTATRTGYTFGGWQASAEWNNVIVTDTAPADAAGNVTLRALWNPNTYYICFHENGGTGTMENEAFRFDNSQALTRNTFERSGYSFSGWAMSESDLPVYLDGDVVLNITATDGAVVDLYAVWSPLTFMIAYNLNGASGSIANSYVTMDDKAITLHGYNITETLIDDETYKFVGWAYTKSDADSGSVVYANRGSFSLNSDVLSSAQVNWEAETPVITLYAVWESADIRLIVPEGQSTVIDRDRNYIYGLKLGITRAELTEEFLGVHGNGRLEIISSGAIGTGTVVQLIGVASNKVLETYEIVIFGDLNGDGVINSTDTTDARMMRARLKSAVFDNPYTFAADVIEDNNINSSDETSIRMLAARIATIDQATREITRLDA